MFPDLAKLPDFYFTFEEDPVRAYRITAICKNTEHRFVVRTDDMITGVELLVEMLDDFRANVA